MQFETFISREDRPWSLVIAEMGDFFNSQLFLERRIYWANFLHESCGGVVMLRTLLTNYGSLFAATEHLYSLFSSVWREEGYSWESFVTWVLGFYTEQIQVRSRSYMHTQ